jgi:2'-5' RNA ligase
MSERWRCFVAAPIPDDVRRTLAAAVAPWRESAGVEGLRWADPDGWHVTLAFLGSVAADTVDGLVADVRRTAAGHAPLALAGDAIGAFPSPRRATVVWCGILDADGSLERLALALRSVLGVDLDQPFRAHLTLARTRGRPLDLAEFIAGTAVQPISFRVERVELMRSHLGRGPARYEVIASAPLGAAVRV